MTIQVVLIGMPGVGKTTVGKLVARRLGVPAFDSDRLISLEAGMTVAEIFENMAWSIFVSWNIRLFAGH